MTIKKKFFSLLSFFLSLTFILGVSFTYAAYLNSDKFSQNYVVDMGFQDKFYSYDETSNTYYINDKQNEDGSVLSASQQLRNLSLITKAGLLDPTLTFVLGTPTTSNIVINYDSTPLIPIGNMHTPFTATFEGNGATINNLKVLGYDEADTGMFGFVAGSGTVRNFILNKPYVTSNSKSTSAFNYDNSKNNIDTNPFRNFFTTSVCKEVKLIEGTKALPLVNNNDPYNQVMTGFTIKLPKITPSTELLYADYKIVSSVGKLSISEITSAGDADRTFQVSNIQLDPTVKILILDIYAVGLCDLKSDKTNDLRFVKFNVESFKLAYDSVNKGFYCNPQNTKCYTKILFPNLVQTGASYTDSSRVTHTDYFSGQHVIYAGIIFGTLNGSANNILVYDGTLDVSNRPFNTNSILIGRGINDYSEGTVTREICNIGSFDTPLDPNTMMVDNRTQDIANNYKTGDYYVKGIYNTVEKGQLGYDNNKFPPKFENAVRIYGQNQVHYPTKRTDADLADYNYVAPTPSGVSVKNYKISDGTEKQFISIDDDMETGMYLSRSWDEGYINVSSSNCISVWINPASVETGILDKLFNSIGDANLIMNITFEYLFFDYSNKLTNDKNTKVQLVIDTSKKTMYDYQSGNWHRRYEGGRYLGGSSSVSSLDFSLDTVKSVRGFRYSPTRKGTDGMMDDWQTEVYYALDKVDREGLKAFNGRSSYDPNRYHYLKIENDENGLFPLEFKKEDVYFSEPDPTKIYETKKKTISIKFDSAYFGKKIWQSEKRTPIFYIGLKSPDRVLTKPDGTTKTLSYVSPKTGNSMDQNLEQPRIPQLDYEFDILSIDVTLSDKKGNMNSKIATIDFGTTGATNSPFFDSSTRKWQNWPSDSLAKPMVEGFYSIYVDATDESFVMEPIVGFPTRYVMYVTRGSRNSSVPEVQYKYAPTTSTANEHMPFDYTGFDNNATYTLNNNLF